MDKNSIFGNASGLGLFNFGQNIKQNKPLFQSNNNSLFNDIPSQNKINENINKPETSNSIFNNTNLFQQTNQKNEQKNMSSQLNFFGGSLYPSLSLRKGVLLHSLDI